MKINSLSSVLMGLSLLLLSQAAAAWPTSVFGTWNVRANQTPGTMHITFQSGAGACRQILGDILGSPMQGFYCPSTGRIQFLRKNSVNDTLQVYSANLTSTGVTNFMGGSFSSYDSAFGEYSFFASK